MKISTKTDTYFIRHKLNGDERELCEAGRIAIWFDNLPITAKTENELGPSIRGAYRTALKYMIRLRNQGGYVFAEYGDGYMGSLGGSGQGFVLAKVQPQDRFEAFTVNDNTYHVTVKLDRNSIGYVRYSEFPVLLAVRPPFSTICQPARTFPLVAAAFFAREKIPGEDALELLHPKMVEQLCVEYLRQPPMGNDRLRYCILRPGKSLAIIDIAGRLDGGRRLFAQVKNVRLSAEYTKDLASQLKDFIRSAREDNTVGVLFGQFEDAIDSDGIVSLVNLHDVIHHFREQNSGIIDDMIGTGTVDTANGPFSIDLDWAK